MEGALRAEEVAARDFSTGFRGFDQSEVRTFLARVATELAAVEERDRNLVERLAEAESAAAVRADPSEADMAAALGQEAGRVLQAAKEAAADIRSRAEREAGAVREAAESVLAERTEEAERVAAAVRAEADASASGLRAEAEAAAGALRAEAGSAAASVRAEADRTARSDLDAAQERGRAMVAEAQAVRERVLKDLARRRKAAHTQLEQLRAGRDRLLDAYRVVRGTLDEATTELQRADAEARAAGEAAGRRVAAEPEPTVEQLEAELVSARDLGVVGPPGDEVVQSAVSAEHGTGDHETAEHDVVVVDEPGPETDPGAQGEPVLAPRSDPGASDPGAGTDAEPSAPAQEQVIEEPEPIEEEALHIGQEPESAIAEPDPAVAEPEPDVEVEPEPEPEPEAEAEAEAERIDVVAVLQEAPVLPAPPPEPVDEAGSPHQNGMLAMPAPVDEEPEVRPGLEQLFARIRADRASTVASAEAVLADQGTAPEAEEVDQPGAEDLEPVAVDPADEALLTARDAVTDDLDRALTRALKRSLADEQNELLDALRRARSRPDADELLPDPVDHALRFAAVAVPPLERAASTGAGGSSAPSVDDLAETLGLELSGDLRSRVERLLASADDGEVGGGLSVAYREWKGERLDALARHAVASAHARGRFAALVEGPIRWVVDPDEGPCPDCDDDALAGPIARGEVFPTGQLHPPAHVGCRCLVVPTSG